jgi:hypothetical protein
MGRVLQGCAAVNFYAKDYTNPFAANAAKRKLQSILFYN